jgi:L-fucose isomerase-like protein
MPDVNNSIKEEWNMKKNIGSWERTFRIVAGLVILSLAFFGPRSPWAYLGIVPFLTGLIGWCPPYALFGFSTCKGCK